MKQQKLLKGRGTAKKLDSLIDVKNINNIFLVTGNRSYENTGVREIIEKLFSPSQVFRFSDFQVNPLFEDIMKGKEFFLEHSYDLIIAAGGGTAIDVAKAIRFFAVQHEDPFQILQGNAEPVPADEPPLLVIPTTSGSGSEATHFSVVYHSHSKYSLAHESMRPDFVCIDGDLTKSLPAHIAAYTGFDALCQGIESFWSVNSTKESRQYSTRAIELVMGNLESSVLHCTAESRMAMAEAAHYAGKAINITKTTGAHAFSYYLTTHFGIPHGQAVGMLIDAFIIFNDGVTESDISDSRGIDYLQEMQSKLYHCLGAETCNQAVEKIRYLRKTLSLEKKLGKFLDTEELKNEFFDSVNTQRLKNNPRLILDYNVGEIKSILFNF